MNFRRRILTDYSEKNLRRAERSRYYNDFMEVIEPLLQTEEVQQLDDFKQHYKFTRLRHSLDVAYFSYVVARFLRWNSRSVARAALLHDLVYHPPQGESSAKQLRTHPHLAAENAKKLCDLTPMEEDIIRKHMFLVTLRPPSYKEGYVVTLLDKLCAVRELFISLFTKHAILGHNETK